MWRMQLNKKPRNMYGEPLMRLLLFRTLTAVPKWEKIRKTPEKFWLIWLIIQMQEGSWFLDLDAKIPILMN